MGKYPLFLLCFLFFHGAMASSSLPSVKLSSPNSKPPAKSKNKKYEYYPAPKKQKALEKHIYSLDRNGVTINSIIISGGLFTITGIYTSNEGLKKFVKQLRGEGNPDRNVQLETKVVRGFAGIMNKEYTITANNLW